MEDLARHLANAGNPQGDYGASLLDVMNAGEHELLSAWGLGWLEEQLAARPARVLDLGCGGGANLVRLHERFGAHVSGLDHSSVSVEKSRAWCVGRLPEDSWDVVQGDVAALPFADASFDLVTAFETLYFWPDAPAAMAEVRRVLAPGGAVFVCNEAGGTPETPEWAETLHLYHEDGLVALLEGAGLTDARTHVTAAGWLCAVAGPVL